LLVIVYFVFCVLVMVVFIFVVISDAIELLVSVIWLLPVLTHAVSNTGGFGEFGGEYYVYYQLLALL